MKENNIENYYPVKTRSIATTIIYEDIVYIFYFLKIIKDFIISIRNLLTLMIKKIYSLFDHQIKKIKNSCSDLNNNTIYIKFYPKYKVENSTENLEETELLIQQHSYIDNSNSCYDKKIFNININLNLNFGSKVKKMYEPELNLVADFRKKKIYNSYHQYINSTEQIYLTHDKSWGWFVDIEAQ